MNHYLFKRNVTLSMIAVIVLVLFFVGCSRNEKLKPDGIKIGVALPLTGDLAAWANRAKNGILLATEEVNKSRNPKDQFKLIIEDTKSQPSGGVSVINKLINVDHVKFIIGDISSGIVLAMAPIAETNHVILLSPAASNPAITKAGDYIFRDWPSDVYDGAALALAAKNELGAKKVLVFYEDNTYSEGLAEAFKQKASKIGLQIVGDERISGQEKDFRSILERHKNSASDLVFVAAHPGMSARLFIQMEETGMKQIKLGCVAIQGPEFVKAFPDATGIYFTTILLDKKNNPVFREFAQQYREKFGQNPDVGAAHAYDALKIFAVAIPNSDTSVEQAKQNLYNLKDFHGATGTMSFDKNGDVIKPLALMKYEHGKAILVKIIKPF